MRNWYLMRRLRSAVMLITFGVLALLSQWHILRFEQSWPIILIVLGLMKIAERTAWSADVREQQYGAGFPPAAPGVVPPAAPNQAYWSASSSGMGADEPLIQPHPPAPDDSPREDR